MKCRTIIKMAALAVVLSLSVVGCRKGLEKTTPLPGRGPGPISEAPPSPPIGSVPKPDDTTGIKVGEGVKPETTTTSKIPDNGIPLSGKLGDYVADSPENQIFKTKTVYFDFDKANIRPSEVSKIEDVASGMKGLAGKALRIEGHCDERGTEEYNRSLGERRALAVRESLVRAGVDPNLIDTISYGKDRPVDPGHNDAAWQKNRRGEFIVIVPPTASTSK